MASTACLCLCGSMISAQRAPFRLEIPRTLPDHPRVFCTQADLDRVRQLIRQDDPYATAVQRHLIATAEDAAAQWQQREDGRIGRGDVRLAARLAEAYALGGRQLFADCARDILLETAAQYPTMETTGARGRIAPSTLVEGPVAIDAAHAYDLLAGTGQLTLDQRALISRDLFRIMGIECGRKCHHRDSSNWRSWALCIIASCGYASGDLELIDEAVNGYWDEQRQAYLYGFVQQLTHSIFSDGIHWERSIGYTYYTAGALMPLMVAAQNSGLDLWHAALPGLTEPFPGSASHEEFGPPGPRRFDAFLLAPLYYAFSDGSLARIGDSGTQQLGSHPIYELAWKEYRDPRFAWVIQQQREQSGQAAAPPGWWFWFPGGQGEGRVEEGIGRDGGGVRLKTQGDRGRAAAVTNVRAPADTDVVVSGWVRALAMNGGRTHIRCNVGRQIHFTDSVTSVGDWQKLSVTVPADEDGGEGWRQIRTHILLEGGEGDVIWDDVEAVADGRVLLRGRFQHANVDGRALSFWSLIHGATDVSAASFDIKKDASIGISGRHVNGSTLFPVGGFAVLRDRPGDIAGPEVLLSYGPYGSGHDHPDRLHISVFGQGEILCPDGGSWGYDNPMHLTWANTTVAHNTVVKNEISQEPQGNSNSIWAAERGDQRVSGELMLFHADDQLKAVRATCDSAYPGTRLDRTVCVIDGLVVDVVRVDNGEDEALFDLPLHGPGEVTIPENASPIGEGEFSERGYSHIRDVVKRDIPAGSETAFVFTRDDVRMRLLQIHLDPGTQYVGKDPEGKFEPTSVVITRRRAASTAFISFIEPLDGERSLQNASVRQADDGLTAVLTRSDGSVDTVQLPKDTRGTIVLLRRDAAGRAVLQRQAPATDTWGEPVR